MATRPGGSHQKETLPVFSKNESYDILKDKMLIRRLCSGIGQEVIFRLRALAFKMGSVMPVLVTGIHAAPPIDSFWKVAF